MSGFAASRYAGSRICDPLRFASFLSVRESGGGDELNGSHTLSGFPGQVERSGAPIRDPGEKPPRKRLVFVFRVDRAASPQVVALGPGSAIHSASLHSSPSGKAGEGTSSTGAIPCSAFPGQAERRSGTQERSGRVAPHLSFDPDF